LEAEGIRNILVPLGEVNERFGNVGGLWRVLYGSIRSDDGGLDGNTGPPRYGHRRAHGMVALPIFFYPGGRIEFNRSVARSE
jgi:hypothetical protein